MVCRHSPGLPARTKFASLSGTVGGEGGTPPRLVACWSRVGGTLPFLSSRLPESLSDTVACSVVWHAFLLGATSVAQGR